MSVQKKSPCQIGLSKGRTISKLPGGVSLFQPDRPFLSLYFPGKQFFPNDPGVQTIFLN